MKIIKRIKATVMPITMTLLLASCATPIHQQTKQQTKQQAKSTATKQKTAAVDSVATAPVAVTKLIEQADQQLSVGNQQAAVSALERAIRIAPRFPDSYFHLAKIRFEQGRYDLAKSFAQKSLSLGAEGWTRWQAERLVDKVSDH